MAMLILLLLLTLALSQGLPEAHFVTFNVGLPRSLFDPAQSETNRTARIAGIVEALKNSDADVVCLQEVWGATLQRHFVEELEEVYPHSVDSLMNTGDTAPCPPASFLPVAAPCFSESGCGVVLATATGIDQVLDCLVNHPFCAALKTYFLQKPACYNCVALTVLAGELNPEVIFGSCVATTSEWNFSGGQLLLSKTPLLAPLITRLPSHFIKNVVQAKTSLPFLGMVGLTCTHLDTIGAGEYATVFGAPATVTSYKELIDFQGGAVNALTFAFENSQAVRQQVLMLDANAGPAGNPSPNGPGEIPDVWQHILAGGRWNEAVQANCTWCGSNPTAINSPSQEIDIIIDHVVYRGFQNSYKSDAETTLDDTVTTNTVIQLSDHIGVKARIGRNRRP